MEFLADNMLGRLARWLRILGYDTTYSKKGVGKFDINKAIAEQRIILTRNSNFKKNIASNELLFIRDDYWKKQVRQVIRELNLRFNEDILLSRCAECNEKLILLSKEKVKRKIPDYVFQTQAIFYGCAKCKRIYWQGTHYFQIEKLIEYFWQKEE